MKKMKCLKVLAAMALAGCVCVDPAATGPEWKPIGKRKVRVVLWGVTHNHAKGKFDALRQLPDLYEIVGVVDNSASKVMRMAEPNLKHYEKYPKFTPEQVLEIIHRSDGVPVLAHPCHIRENLHGLVRELVSMGLLGIEAYYPANTARQTELYVSLAHQYRLLATCGSDFHGKNRPGVPVGCAWRESRELERTYETLIRRMES